MAELESTIAESLAGRTKQPSSVRCSGTYSKDLLIAAVVLLDLAAVVGMGILVYLLNWEWQVGPYLPYSGAGMLASLLTIGAFNSLGLYEVRAICEPTGQVDKLFMGHSLVFVLLGSLLFLLGLGDHFPWVWLCIWFLASMILLLLARFLAFQVICGMVRTHRLRRNLLVVGGGEQVETLLAGLDRTSEPWNHVLGIFDDRVKRSRPAINGVPVLGPTREILSFARAHRVNDIILALPWTALSRVQQIADKLAELPVDIRVACDPEAFLPPPCNIGEIGDVPMLRVMAKPFAGWKGIVKTLEDKMLAGCLLAAFSPVLLLIAIVIKSQGGGSVLFKQRRHGFNNRYFFVYKFRTMHQALSSSSGAQQVTRDDPRTTRFGSFLRRTSLDELPQLFNVLEGSMSMVGPRPHPVPLNEQYAPIINKYFARHRVKPGITGWAQINGLRGPIHSTDEMRRRVEHDIHYIENWSLLLDLKVLCLTLFRGFVNKNAY